MLHHRGADRGGDGADGPNGDGGTVRLVSAQQGRHCQLLVRHKVQGHVPPLGPPWLQHDHRWRVSLVFWRVS